MGKIVKEEKKQLPPVTVEDKKRLHQVCLHAVTTRLQRLKSTQLELQESANEETKSSAGDKYETGRSMAQLEIGKLAEQIRDAENQLKILNSIKETTPEKIQLGSLVFTNFAVYYLAASIGPVEIQEHKFFVISAYSPMGKAMMGKKKGEIFENMNKKVMVKNIL